ncbi:MAG: hypothetical protein GY915_01730 [bacterium]|nr:hypothetical protein [bacterium]
MGGTWGSFRLSWSDVERKGARVNRVFILFSFTVLVWTTLCHGEGDWPCLMLTPEEEAFAKGMGFEEDSLEIGAFSGENLNDLLSSGLYLGGIVYLNESNWSFWLNGQKMSSAQDLPEEFTLRSVNAHSVSLTWNRGGELHAVTLKPHHTYDPIQRRVRLGNCLCE